MSNNEKEKNQLTSSDDSLPADQKVETEEERWRREARESEENEVVVDYL